MAFERGVEFIRQQSEIYKIFSKATMFLNLR